MAGLEGTGSGTQAKGQTTGEHPEAQDIILIASVVGRADTGMVGMIASCYRKRDRKGCTASGVIVVRTSMYYTLPLTCLVICIEDIAPTQRPTRIILLGAMTQ